MIKGAGVELSMLREYMHTHKHKDLKWLFIMLHLSCILKVKQPFSAAVLAASNFTVHSSAL